MNKAPNGYVYCEGCGRIFHNLGYATHRASCMDGVGDE